MRLDPDDSRSGGDDELSRDVAEVRRSGDPAAFSRVFRAIQPGLVRYLRVYVGADAEDAASEAWAHVCRDIERFSGDGNDFRAWVATIGRNRSLDMLRARKRRPAVGGELAESVLAAVPDATTTEDAALAAWSTSAAVAVINQLPREQAEAVLLRVVMGLDAASVGRVLGKRPGAVRTAVYRGLKTLGQRLDATASVPPAEQCDVLAPASADQPL